MGMQTDVLGFEAIYEAGMGQGQLDTNKGAGILKKTLTQATKSYQPKYQKTIKSIRKYEDSNKQDEVPPITEDDLNLGIQSLLNKGKIPKDVDLTPAFEKGAPPVTFKGMKFHDKKDLHVKKEVHILHHIVNVNV